MEAETQLVESYVAKWMRAGVGDRQCLRDSRREVEEYVAPGIAKNTNYTIIYHPLLLFL